MSKAGPDTTVIEPDSDSFGRSLIPAVSGQFRVDGACIRKGSSHSGFSAEIVTDFNNRPF